MNKIKECAVYCLNCKTKPCSNKGCPIQTNIPEFIMEVKNENYEKAYQILQENNIFWLFPSKFNSLSPRMLFFS